MELQAFILSLLLLTIVSETQSRSLDNSFQCASACPEPTKFDYSVGYTYQYNYNADVTSSFYEEATEGQKSTVHIQASLLVDVLSPCELVLRISRASIDAPGTSEWETSLQRNPLHFNFQDGRIPEICSSNDDPTWVLNIKRGMLSAFQVSSVVEEPSVREVDVSGDCQSSYEVVSESNNVIITKQKDYNTCAGRDQHLLFSHFTPYPSDSPRQNFIYSEQSCRQQLTNSVMQSTTCTEQHTFRPFSTAESGARTSITQRLQFASKSRTYGAERLGSNVARRTTLAFEGEEMAAITSSDISELQGLFSTVCETMSTENYKKVGEEFIRMVFLLRRLDVPALQQALNSLDGACTVWESALKEMFRDGLQWCGSEACVVFETRMIAAGREEVDDATSDRWLTGMSLITKPTPPMLEGLINVARSNRLMQKAYLTAGTMIHKICNSATTNCLTMPIVSDAIAFFQDKLGYNCRTTNLESKQEILLSLRSLGNAGRFTAIRTISLCASEEGNDMETRVSAVEAFRRLPCNSDRSEISSIIFNTEVDAELRISSYLALMQCPTPAFIAQISAMLDTEPVRQVASFVWTHLNQLMESTDPLKGYLKPLLTETVFLKKHDLDPRKYSRFYENSLFSEQLNAGATLESSLVWSPKSFMPRSANLNFTVDVFGQAVNLFEVGGRVEGVETLLQSFMGPKGFLKNSPLSDLFMAPDEDAEEEEEPEVEEERISRSTDDTRLVELQTQYKTGLNTENKPNANWYMRVFGNEMFYGNSREMAIPTAESGSINILPIMQQLAEGGHYQYHDDTMIVNSAHVLPTGVGLPLTIAFNGSASIDVNADGRLDMTGLFSTPPQLTVNGQVLPRAVIYMTGSMTVDAHVHRTGIATESSAMTSWTLGGQVSLEQGQRLSMRLDAPFRENTVFKFNHKLMTIAGEEVTDMQSDNLALTQDVCSQDYAGHRLCYDNHLTPQTGSLIFPVQGQVGITAYLEKTDSGIDHYLLSGTYQPTYTDSMFPDTLTASLVLDTPNSNVNRRMSLDIAYNKAEMTASVSYVRPGTEASLVGSVENTQHGVMAVMTYNRNGEETELRTVVENGRSGTERQISALSTLQTPTKRITGSAQMILDPQRRMVVNMSILNVATTPISLHLNLQDNTEEQSRRLRYSGSVNVALPGIIDSGLQFNMNIKPKSDIFIFALDYTFTGSEEQRLYFHHKRRDQSTSSLTSWSAEQKFTFTQYPMMNHHVELSYSNGPGSLSSEVKVGYGRHAGRDGNTRYLLVSQEFSYQIGAGTRQINGRAQLSVPISNMNYVADLSHSQSPTSISTEANMGEYGLVFSFNDRSADTGLLNYDVELSIPTPWGRIHGSDRIVETSANIYRINSDFGIGETQDLTLSGETTIVNLPETKSITMRVLGSNNEELLRASSVNQFLAPFGFSTENSLESRYNNRLMFNLRHEGAKEGGFESNLMFKHNPDKYLDILVDSENLETAKRLVRVSFKDHVGVSRFVQLQATKSSIEDTVSANVSFTNNIPALYVQNLAARVEFTGASGQQALHSSVTLNDVEKIGVDATRTYTIQRDNSALTNVRVAIRQRLCQTSPASIELNTDVTNTISAGHTVAAQLTQDGQQKLSTTFTIADDQRSFQGNVRQTYSRNLPTESSFDVTILSNGVNVDLTSDRSTGRINLVKNSGPSVTLTMTHNNRMMVEQGVPRNLLATLTWGSLRGDEIGVRLNGNVNREDFNMKVAYSTTTAQPFYVTVVASHEVRSLRAALPQIRFVIRTYGTTTNGGFETYLNVDDLQMMSVSLSRENTVFQLQALHQCPIAISLGLPQTIKATVNKTVASGNNYMTTSLKVDETYTEGSLTLATDSIGVHYFSNCSCIPGKFDVQFTYPQGQVTGNVLIRIGNSKQASISAGYTGPTQFNLEWNQNLYVDEEMPHLPTSGLLRYQFSTRESEILGEYNDYRVRLTSTASDVTSPDMMVFDWTLEQNILTSFAVMTNHYEVTMTPTSFSDNLRYSFDNGARRFMRTTFSFGELEDDSNGLQINAAISHNSPTMTGYGIPEDIKVVLSGTPIGLGFKGSLVATVDRNMRKMQLMTGVDAETNTLRFSFAHDLTSLSNLGVFNNFTAHIHCTPTATDNRYGISTGGFVQINEEQYSASATGSVQNDMENSRLRLIVDLSQDINILYHYNVPKRVQTNTMVDYGVSGWSGLSSITSTITRTMYDPETEETRDIVNTINGRVNIELFNYNLAVSGSHDFNVSFMPNNIRYEISASGSTSSQPTGILYKSLMMAVTIDGRKQMATLTVNRNRNERSFYLSSSHNVTQVYQYGVPGNMSISIRMLDAYNADVSIVYDTAKKSVGFRFDYDGHRNKLVFYVNHNFDMLVQMFYIPKNFGFETSFTKSERRAEGDLKYVWGPIIKFAHLTTTWEPNWRTSPAFTYRLGHNITAEELWYFPRNSQMQFLSNYYDNGFNIRVSALRKSVTLAYDTSASADMPVAARFTVTQTYDMVNYPRMTTLEVDLDRSVQNTEKLHVIVSFDREVKLATTVTAKYNMETLSGSVAIQNRQEFVESDVFPTNIDLFGNCSVNYEFTSYFTLERDDLPRFMIQVKSGIDVAEQSGFVELAHSQRSWKRSGLLKNVRLDVNYNPDEKSVVIAVKQGRSRNTINAAVDYRLSSEHVYGHAEMSHDFTSTPVPRIIQATVLLEKGRASLGANMNVTFDTTVLTHSIEARYDVSATSFMTQFEANQDNIFLTDMYNVPHTVATNINANWGTDMTGGISTQYGDKTTKLRITTNRETDAEVIFRHNWSFTPNNVRVIITRSLEDNSATMSVNIDGVERQIVLSGSLNEGVGNAHFTHTFEGTQIPQMVILSGAYRKEPDMHVEVSAMIDGTEHSFSAGFEKLEDGFTISSTLLDDVSRRATFRRNIVPGGFSVDLEHNIPELQAYVPGSIGATASARMNPRPNITASFRQQSVSNSLTAEADITALRFSFQHDFEILPIPRSVNLEMSGTATPVSGSLTLTMDGHQRQLTGSVDPQNMVASMMNSFPELPLPETLSVRLHGSASPLSGGLSITVNGLERTASASYDTSRMRGQFQHNADELDQLYVPRDIIVSVSGTAQPVSGEVYVSIDGLERRVGATFNRPGGVLSLFQSAPEFSYMPRNVTLHVSGSMQPMTGQISLTIDEVERSVNAEVNTRSLFSVTHSVPEVEPYIPRHLAISTGFTSTSGRVTVEYDVNRVRKSVNVGATLEDNHLRLQATQNVNTARNVPQHIVVQLAGSMENKNFTVLVSVDDTNFDTTGEIYTGAAEGWYGISLRSQHNIPAITETLSLPPTMETTFKVRKDAQSYEMAITLDLFQGHEYTSVTTLTPIITRSEKAIRASYEHHYSAMTRSVSGSATLSEGDGHYNIDVQGQQTQPERRQMQTQMTVSPLVNTLSGSHNIPEFTEIGIPQEIRNGRTSLSYDLDSRTARASAQATVDGVMHGYSADVSADIEGERNEATFTATARNGPDEKRYTTTISYNVMTAGNIQTGVTWSVQDMPTLRMQRDDEISFDLQLESPSKSITMTVRQPELNNLGVPLQTRAAYINREPNGSGFNRALEIHLDEMTWQTTAEYHKSSSPFHFDLKWTMSNTIAFFPFPHTMSFLVAANTLYTGDSSELDAKVVSSWNNQVLSYNITQTLGNTNGRLVQHITNSVQALQQYFGNLKIVESYSYANRDITINQLIYKGSPLVEIGNYNLVLTEEGDISASYTYDDMGYDFDFRFSKEEGQSGLTITLNKAETSLVRFTYAITPNTFSVTANNHAFGPEFEMDFSTDASHGGQVEITLTSMLVLAGVRHSVEGHDQITFSDEQVGWVTSMAYTGAQSSSLNIQSTMTGHRNENRGSFTYSMTNRKVLSVLPKRITVSVTSTPTSINGNLAYGQKRFTLDMASDAEEASVNAHITQENFKTLRRMGMPGDIQFTGQLTQTRKHISTTMDNIDVVEINLREGAPVVRVNKMNGDPFLSITGRYSLTPDKSFNADIVCTPLGLDMTSSFELLTFQPVTGNSNFNFVVHDNTDNSEFRAQAHLNPTSSEALDFEGQASVTCDFPLMPFTSRVSISSTANSNTNAVTHLISMSLDDSEITIRDEYTPTQLSVTITQPFSQMPPRLTFVASESAEEEYTVRTLSATWGEQTLEVECKGKSVSLIQDHTLTITQPSALLGFSEFNANLKVDQMATSQKYVFQLNGNLDTNVLGMNASYAGVLPQSFGAHNIIVDIQHPFSNNVIPSEFKTTGNMEFSTAGLYHSDWRITSQRRELVVLKKVFTPLENGYDLVFLWKQSLVTTPARYISLTSDGSSSATGLQSKATLGIDNLPPMTGGLQYNIESDDTFTNKSVAVSVTTGPLSKWLVLRTLSVATWYKTESNSRQTAPSFGLTVIPDGQKWVLNGGYESSSGRRSNKLETSVTFNHPMQLRLFNTPVPQENTGSIALLKRGKGSSFVTKYQNEMMDEEMKMTTRYRVGTADSLFQGNTAVVLGDASVFSSSLDIGEDEANSGYNINLRISHPASTLDGNLVLNTFNSNERIGFSAITKDYSEGVRTWEHRFSYIKPTNTIEYYQNGPDMQEPITITGDLTQVMRQVKQIMRNLAADATHTRLQFVKGMTETDNGYDMYIGYDIVDDATYTLHLVAGAEAENMFVKLETRKNSELDTPIARADINLANEQLIQVRLSANPVITNFLSKIISASDVEFARKLNWFTANVVQALEAVKTIITGNNNMESVVNAYIDGLITKVEAARDAAIQFVSSLSTRTTSTLGTSELVLEQLVRSGITNLLTSITSLKDQVMQPFEQLTQQYYGQILETANAKLLRTLEPVTAALRKIHAGELFIELVQDAVAKTSVFMMTNGEAAFAASRIPLENLFVVTNSEIIFNIPLRFELDHFTPLPTLGDIKTWLAQSAFSIQIDDTVKMLYSYVDDYYRARAVMFMPRDEMLPPFKGHSFVSGFKHFSTFDKKHYDFSSACATTHILASDHRDGNFTISLTYADPALESSMNALEIIVENRRVTIFTDYSVRVGGRTKNLPLAVGKMAVTLEGRTVHVRHTDGGMDVACDFTTELCTVDVSPYYFGATAGLAGTFNNEPMDDFTSPSHVIMDSPNQLATAWEASGTTCPGNVAAPVAPECTSTTRQAICSAIFESKNSVHRGCFPLVDPAPFMTMCMSDMCNEDDQTKSCAASAAYAYRCGLLGASFGQPDHCIMCSATNGDQFNAGSRSVETEVNGIDLVMVVEEGRCMGRSGISKAMKKMFKKLLAGLSETRMRNTQYTLVGYGGTGANMAPHTYTMRNRLATTNRKNDLVKALRKLSLSAEEREVDPLAAISYASQLPFRAGAKPVIVILSCDQCSSNSQVSYSNVEWQLRQQGITLHHVTQNTIVGARKSIFGFDSENAYMRHNRPESFSIVKPNKHDACVPLATSTGGSVWDATFLANLDFAAKFGNYIGTKNTRVTQSCKCQLNAAGMATAVCT
nr:uncharacterized protein LOC100186072 [Ciona intestinalis]|eukprot:XP_002124291.1 uncharacterized protein LOC100186072 [Ciona intestinalis]